MYKELEIGDTITKSPQMDGKPFFEYDEIVYYFNNYDESKLQELTDNRTKSEIDALKQRVIVGDKPKDILDLTFIDKLEKIGYKKSNLDKLKFADIDKIFIEKSVNEYFATACIHIYRDILIFKKQNKVIGTAKICFSCLGYQIKGATANTDNFGQEEDWCLLGKVLRE